MTGPLRMMIMHAKIWKLAYYVVMERTSDETNFFAAAAETWKAARKKVVEPEEVTFFSCLFLALAVLLQL